MIALLLSWSALADEVRVGLFVGHNYGSASMEQLLFAEADARKIQDLFVEHGQITAEDAVLLRSPSKRAMISALADSAGRIARAKAQGHRTVFVFYYSGHGDDEGLQLGNQQLTHSELEQWLAASGADVRVALLDACHAGAAIRSKGGQRGPDYAFDVRATETRGTAILTSSAASEVSQESEELGGGFFTHYLHTALSGAADKDNDGDVSLYEAYEYVHQETAFRTRTAPEAQTPSHDFDLSGSSEVVLTVLEDASAWLVFPGQLDGTFAVWDDTRKRYVAELPGDRGRPLAVRPGQYVVQRRQPGWVEEARYRVQRGDARTVDPADLERHSYDDTAAKGWLRREARKARMPDLTLRAFVGARGFGDSPWGNSVMPGHAVGGLQVRWLRRSGAWYGADLLSGGGSGEVSFAQSGSRRVDVYSVSGSAAAGWSTPPFWLRGGVGGRASVVQFARFFAEDEVEAQGVTSMAVGVSHWGGLHLGRFSLELEVDLMLLPVAVDGMGWPVYGDLGVVAGVRF